MNKLEKLFSHSLFLIRFSLNCDIIFILEHADIFLVAVRFTIDFAVASRCSAAESMVKVSVQNVSKRPLYFCGVLFCWPFIAVLAIPVTQDILTERYNSLSRVP